METIEQRQGLKIACLEEVAYRMGYIGAEEVMRLSHDMHKNTYGQYLIKMLEVEEQLE